MMAAGPGGNRGGGKSDSGCISEIELMRFPSGLDVGYKRKGSGITKRFMACEAGRMKSLAAEVERLWAYQVS